MRSVPTLFVATLLSAALAPGGAVADQVLPLTNPGFEQPAPTGQVAGWKLDTEVSSTGAVLSLDAESSRAGNASLRLALPGHGSATVVSDPLRLDVGHLYRLSGWIRSLDVTSAPTTRYPTGVPACLSMASFPFTNHSPAVGGSTGWTRVETLFFATQSDDRVRLHLGHNGAARGTVWFDDLMLQKVDDITEAIPLDTVRWSGPGFRYDDRGWIFVHIEGEPYERGYQYGSLVADEIVDYIFKLGVRAYEDDPEAGWKRVRFECDTLFLRVFDEEYLREMRGIADGAAAAGAEIWGEPIGLRDIVAINSVIDLGQLEDAVEVTPHALTGEAFIAPDEELDVAPQNHHCSAFAATGPATRDGQVVFGQIFMWNGYTGVHWNVITDVQPTTGHRLVYHTFPGGIHSGADFYINSAGIVIGETTVSQTPYEPDSTPQSNRIRKAAQYASSIDDVERILWDKNNGMYTNDWPIADVKTGEVAILLLGTHTKKLWRTGEDMNPFGTPGFLWANNNNRDPQVRKEYLAQPHDRPFDLIFSPWNRDVAFNEFYDEHAGEIDAIAGVNLWATSPINRAHACDGKITTTEMARELVFLAHHGKVTLREKFPTKDWRYLPDLPQAVPHLSLGYSVASPIFVAERLQAARAAQQVAEEPAETPDLDPGELEAELKIERDDLWARTVFPASDRDSWFVSATAAYWNILDGLGDLDDEDPSAAPQHVADELAALALRWQYTVSREEDLAAVEAHRAYDRYGPYLLPRIKGTFALHQLRLWLGTETFLEVMDATHRRFAEREMSSADFVAVADEISGKDVGPFLAQWIEREGLPELKPSTELREVRDGGFELSLEVTQQGTPYHLLTHVVVTTGETRHLRRLELGGKRTTVSWEFDERPTRLVFNALDDVPVARSDFYAWRNFIDDFHSTLIVYGTARQIEANHTMARRWQEKVADTYVEILPPLVKDAELDLEQARSHDLIVMGTLDDNYLFDAVSRHTAVELGRNHFRFRDRTYAHPDDGLFLVLPNPFNPERVMYVLAANSGLELWRMTQTYHRDIPSWAVYRGDEIVEQGYHEPEGFVIDLPSVAR